MERLAATPYVAYYRVSTQKQGESGLGLEAQQASVRQFLASRGGTLVAEFTEVESGRKNKRPQLDAALARVRAAGGVLLVAKLDRLTRNVAFLATLMDAQVQFKAADMPDADEFTVHILAAVAQREAQLISARTKAALKALKARGVQLGNAGHFTDEHRALGAVATRRKAQEHPGNKQARRMSNLLRQAGSTLAQIAEELNNHGFTTRYGKQFTKTTVRRLLLPMDLEKLPMAGATP